MTHYASIRLALIAAVAAITAAASATPNLNIVLVVTDDLDALLGSVDAALPRTVGLLGGENGTTATRWFAHTPICCPSRAQILTGRYFHNLRNQQNVAAPSCMHVNVSSDPKDPGYAFYTEKYFATHFKQLGYSVGVFGKHLNNQNPGSAPPGVDRWFVNGGGNYFSPTFTGYDGKPAKFNNCTDDELAGAKGACYSTSVIGNVSIAWIEAHMDEHPSQPFFAYVAVKAPHIQDGPGWPVTEEAPWYNTSFPATTTKAPRTPNWNLTGAAVQDHHWLIRAQPGMTDEQVEKSDALYAHRLRSLLSVDDLVVSLCDALERRGVLDSTLIAFTSDHGFQAGQFGMPEGKWNAFENDLRVPFFIRGPGITKGGVFSQPASHVDIMPTLLEFAGASKTPPSMDGRSAAHLLAPGRVITAPPRPWRTAQLIEYMGGDVVRYSALEDSSNNTFRLLRVVDPAAPKGKKNIMYTEFTDIKNVDFKKPASEIELFDLDADPWQQRNLAKQLPEVVSDLKVRLAKLAVCRGNKCT